MTKRAIDVVVGSLLVVLTAPLVVMLAAGVVWSLGSSPFYVQERVGRGGTTFRMWKLRTLPSSTPDDTDKYAIRSVATTRFARFLRSTHLDELPQLALVPLGRMSLVGPRPEMKRLHAGGDPAFARIRTSVRPGCTGLWQTSVDQHRLIWEAPQYDLFYVRHANSMLDVWILGRTVLMMAGLRPPISLDDVPARLLAGPKSSPRQPLLRTTSMDPIDERAAG